MTSVSEVEWKMPPISSNSSRSSAALVRLPLWARAMGPFTWRMTKGWALARTGVPVVAYRQWPMHMLPRGMLSSTSLVNTSFTRPSSRRL